MIALRSVQGKMAEHSAFPQVTQLNIFPLKSAKGIQVDRMDLNNFGVVGDRNYMLINGTTGRFVSQRQLSKMALIRAEYLDLNEKRSAKFSAEGMPDLVVHPTMDGQVRTVTVWSQSAPAVDQGDEAAEWFAKFLGAGATYIRLVYFRMDDPQSRQVEKLPEQFKAALNDKHVAFQDEAPVTLLSQESLEDLNGKLKERVGREVGMDRFRMNIEISGCQKAFEEDEWLAVKIGGNSFMVYADAERCKLTNVNQATGESDKFGPLDMLRSYRAAKGPTHACFGRKLVPLVPQCSVAVGDRVEVLERVK